MLPIFTKVTFWFCFPWWKRKFNEVSYNGKIKRHYKNVDCHSSRPISNFSTYSYLDSHCRLNKRQNTIANYCNIYKTFKGPRLYNIFWRLLIDFWQLLLITSILFAKHSNLYDLSHYKSVYYLQFCVQKFKWEFMLLDMKKYTHILN